MHFDFKFCRPWFDDIDMKMMTYLEAVWWGPHLVNVSFMNHGASENATVYEEDFSWVESVKEGFCGPKDSAVENDEVIAHALQEEFSRVAVAEVSETSSLEQQIQVSVLDQDWHLNSEYGCKQEACKQVAVLSDFAELSVDADNLDVSPRIEDESILDGEVGKRMNQMTAIPHVPKINGEIPSIDEATSDHQRLLNRLQLYDLVELKILGDGNCQFRSLSDQIYRTPEHHKFVREQVINQLKSQPELYKNYVPMTYGEYLKKMSGFGEWGDNITLQAAADWYGIKIFVVTSFKDTCYIEILPRTQKSNRIVFLSFWAEVHYNSIYPMGELPGEEEGKKKKSN
ncbi:OVARIAN TUMOR DOMAIN-containing deubiquitinating enzyme 12-like isoform X1 [Primulina huaijiensis]|uniref:OVARIAN TUMOR DOMAIN-containing deubiquitinating enzyme 12-like isoform X1 n=2 Tax=Primulina huaijiensis TaxID=1492673 RepID=UPI003CC76F6E